MSAAGVDSPLGELLPLIRSVVSGVDVARLEVPEAARLVEECAEAERLFAALRVVVAATLENAALWRREGFRSLGQWMASKTGTPVGPAAASLEMAGRLDGYRRWRRHSGAVGCRRFRPGRSPRWPPRCPTPPSSCRGGRKADAARVAGRVPARRSRGVDRRRRAASSSAQAAPHPGLGPEGAGHLSADMTPDELARIMAVVNAHTDGIVADAILGGWFESREAHSVDALVDLIRPDSTTSAGPETMLHVVVDYDALCGATR